MNSGSSWGCEVPGWVTLLNENHPSFGCPSAWFVFSFNNPISKIFLVEAKNEQSVQVLERLLINGEVSSKCSILFVSRNSTTVGIRSELVEEISYVDFVTDIVDPNLLDKEIVAAFQESISQEEFVYIRKKCEQINQTQLIPTNNVKALQSGPDFLLQKKLFGALSGLGFSKSDVKNYIHNLDMTSRDLPLSELIMRGIRSLS